MTTKAHRLHALKKIRHTAYSLFILATSVALCLLVVRFVLDTVYLLQMPH